MKTPNSGNAFFHTFVVCLVLVSIPVKNFAYVVPLVYLFLQFIWGNRRLTTRTLGVLAVVLTVSSFSLLWDSCRGQQVNLPGMFLAVLTFLPLAILVSERFDRAVDKDLFQKMVTLCSWFVIVQSVIGVVQFIVAKNSDAVSGTFGLFDFVTGHITIVHVFFTFTMYGMILFLSCSATKPLPLVAIGLGIVSTTMANSAHQLIFFVLCVGLVSAFRFFRFRTLASCALLVASVVLMVNHIYPGTMELAHHWYEKVVQNQNSPKHLATNGGLAILSDPKNFVLGTGIGQYSSRAALITSNQYLTTKLPSWASGWSMYYWETIRPASYVFSDTGEGSAMSKPYYSMLTVLVEFGLLQSLILGGMLVIGVGRHIRLAASARPEIGLMALLGTIGILFLLLCCMIENYLEFPQAILIPLLLYTFAMSRVNTLTAAEPATAPRAKTSSSDPTALQTMATPPYPQGT